MNACAQQAMGMDEICKYYFTSGKSGASDSG
jgi:hypothetical protein